MVRVILLVLALSWDSFVIGLLDGVLSISGNRVLRVLALFSVCEGGALALGIYLRNTPQLWLEQLADLLFCVSVLLVFLLAFYRIGKRWQGNSRAVYLLPLLLSVDNFSLGGLFSGIGIPSVVSVLSVGATSAAIFGLGVLCGKLARARLVPRLPAAVRLGDWSSRAQ